jgi:hypothetical protein
VTVAMRTSVTVGNGVFWFGIPVGIRIAVGPAPARDVVRFVIVVQTATMMKMAVAVATPRYAYPSSGR